MEKYPILAMNLKEILAADFRDFNKLLTEDELLHIFKLCGAFWHYDYPALEAGRPGLHALLKSENHSDGFFISKLVLQYPNLLELFARQIWLKLQSKGIKLPDFIAGVPDSATELGKAVSRLSGIPHFNLIKKDGKIVIDPEQAMPAESSTIFLVEDVCTKLTGFIEAACSIHCSNWDLRTMPLNIPLLNRGGLRSWDVYNAEVEINGLLNLRLNDWTTEECPLCKAGSKPIKPKAEPENWELLTNSQK